MERLLRSGQSFSKKPKTQKRPRSVPWEERSDRRHGCGRADERLGGVARQSLPFSKSLFLRIESVDILAHIPTIPPVILSLSKLLLYIAFIRLYIRVKSAWTFFNPRRVVRSTLTVRQPIKRKVELVPYLGVAGACKARRRRCAILPHDRCRRRTWRWGCPSKTQTVVEPVSLALASVASRLGQACR